MFGELIIAEDLFHELDVHSLLWGVFLEWHKVARLHIHFSIFLLQCC